MSITVFENIRSTNKPYITTVAEAIRRIKDGHSKKLVDEIRSKETKKEQAPIKEKLPSFIFAGKSTKEVWIKKPNQEER